MLREIELDHFKCFRALTLPLGGLTLLTGVNASGKSTVLQALVLLHQTATDGQWQPSCILDGSVISLGTVADIVNQIHGRRSFSLGLRGESGGYRWTFEAAQSDKKDIAVPAKTAVFYSDASSQTLIGPDVSDGITTPSLRAKQDAEIATAIETLSYVSAERLGPREVYPLGDPKQHRTVGAQGERAPGLIYWFGDDPEQPVLPGLRLDAPPTLARQTEAWLAHFFPGAGYEVQPVRGANLVTLGLRTALDEEYHRPQHVGFGLSHLFPIIVAILHAQVGELVVIENPEVHLHPQGQAKVGYFLARAAKAGVQVVLETHSDHVLNGVRRAVHDGVVASEDVRIHFFLPRAEAETNQSAQVVSPDLDRHGNIDHWPDGFFDQSEKDLSYLAGL